MKLNFVGPVVKTNTKQMTTETFYCEVTPRDTLQVVRVNRQDLINMHSGRVNFIGDTKPKLGTLEEKQDVFLVSWVYLDAQGQPRIRPVVGRFMGGCETFADAKQLATDVWKHRDRFRTSLAKVLR